MVPPAPILELRDLWQRVQKTLEDANIKLDSVVSDVLGTSGRRILEAIIAGQADGEQLA